MRAYKNRSPLQYSKGLDLILVLLLIPDSTLVPAPEDTQH